jgi:hypothetical protein
VDTQIRSFKMGYGSSSIATFSLIYEDLLTGTSSKSLFHHWVAYTSGLRQGMSWCPRRSSNRPVKSISIMP